MIQKVCRPIVARQDEVQGISGYSILEKVYQGTIQIELNIRDMIEVP